MRARRWIAWAGVGWLAVTGVGVSLDNPEGRVPGKSITERNAFNLKPPTPPAPPPAPPPPATKVHLTGVFSIMGNKRAILQISEPGKATPESRVVQEGDREGDVEVLAIDTQTETVRVKIRDQEKELDFKNDGIAPPTAPAAAFMLPTNVVRTLPPGMVGGALNATTGTPMPNQPPPNLQPGTLWRPDGTIIQPGGTVIIPGGAVTNPAATQYQPPTRVIRTP